MSREVMDKSIEVGAELSDKIRVMIKAALTAANPEEVSLELISSYTIYSLWVTHLSVIKEISGLDAVMEIIDQEVERIRSYFTDTEVSTSDA